MAAKTYAMAGNTALKESSASHLTLVYDSNTMKPAEHEVCPFRSMIVCAIAFAVVMFGFSMAVSGYRGLKTSQLLNGAKVEEVRVVRGDTLWSIANRCVGETVSTEDAMQWISDHNDLGTSTLKPGQRLSVPVL